MPIPKDDTLAFGALPPATRDAFEEQATQELLKRARRYAQTRVPLVCRAGRPVSDTYARELVHDALADTWTGDLAWDPSLCSLLEHLCHAIKHRTWAEIRHVGRVRLVSLHGSANDRPSSRPLEHALVYPSNGDCSPIVLRAISAMVCRELRSLVPRGHVAAVLLQCWEDGFITRDEVMKCAGLSESAYDCARKRLLYACRNLTPALRESVLDLLRSPS